MTKDTPAKAQTDLRSEAEKRGIGADYRRPMTGDLRREMTMTGLRMAPEVLEALIKIGGVTTRVKDALDKKGAMT